METLTIHAFLSGTMWSMSTSLACVQVPSSYGLFQVPDVAAHASLTLTSVPSRLSTNSLFPSATTSGSVSGTVPRVAGAVDRLPVGKLFAAVAVAAAGRGDLEAVEQGPRGGRAGDDGLRRQSVVKC